MLAEQRQEKIISLIKKHGGVRISELTELFSVTSETLRRDLAHLEKQHLLTKTHGGATLSHHNPTDTSFYVRRDENIEAKKIIANLAISFIQPQDTIILGVSTSTFYLAEKIENRNDLTIITNSLQTINLLNQSELNIIGIGGSLDNNLEAFTGAQTLKSLGNLYASSSFISCTGIDQNLGLMDISAEEAAVKELSLINSEKRYLLADSSKFGKKGIIKMNGLENINCIITEKKPTKEWLDFLKQFKIKIVYPDNSTN